MKKLKRIVGELADMADKINDFKAMPLPVIFTCDGVIKRAAPITDRANSLKEQMDKRDDVGDDEIPAQECRSELLQKPMPLRKLSLRPGQNWQPSLRKMIPQPKNTGGSRIYRLTTQLVT